MDDADEARLERDRRRRPVFFPNHPARAGWTGRRMVTVHAILAFDLVVANVEVFRVAGAAGMRKPSPLTWTALALTVVAFAVIVPRGALDSFRSRRLEAALRRHPDAPWLAERRWDPRGETRSAWSRIPLLPALYALVFAPLFLLMALLAPGPFGVVFFFVVCTLFLTPWAVLLWKAFGVGTTRVGFTQFPCFAGERVTLTFGAGSDGATFERIGYRLRLLVEEPGRLPPWHRAIVTIDLGPLTSSGVLPGPDRDVEVSFDLPADVPGTRLGGAFPRWWVLDVAGMTSSGPYSEWFLVPIYDRPAEAAPPLT